MAKYLVLSIKDAERYNLVGCTCGHPLNNHHNWDKRPCAHCKCNEFELDARVGRLIDVPAITEADLADAIKETA